MTNRVRIRVNGRELTAAPDASLAAILLDAGAPGFAPLCGMGVCFQCRVSVDGRANVRSCQITVRDGMEIVTP